MSLDAFESTPNIQDPTSAVEIAAVKAATELLPVPTPAERVLGMLATPDAALGAARSQLRIEVESLRAEGVTYKDSPHATDCETMYAGHEHWYGNTIRELRVAMGKDPGSPVERGNVFNDDGTDASWHMYTSLAADGQAVPMVSCVLLTMKDGRPADLNGQYAIEVRAYPLQTASEEYLNSLPPTYENSPERANVVRFYGLMRHHVAFSGDMTFSAISSHELEIEPFDTVVADIIGSITGEARAKVVGQLLDEYMSLPGPDSEVSSLSFADAYANAHAILLTRQITDPDSVLKALHIAFSQKSIEDLKQLLNQPITTLQKLLVTHGMRERYDWLLRRAPDVYRQVQAAERKAVLEQFAQRFTQRLRADEQKIQLLAAVSQGLQGTQLVTPYLSPDQPSKKKKR